MSEFEKRKRLLQIAADAIKYRAEEVQIMLCNLECGENAEAAKEAGLLSTFRELNELKRAGAEIEEMLIDCANLPGWRHIGNYPGGVYICPRCDQKSPDDFVFCPNCGRAIGRGAVK